MNKINKFLALFFIIIGVVGVVLTAKGFFNQEVASKEETFRSENIENIIIDSDVANIRMLPTTEEEIKVEWSGKMLKSNKNKVQIEEDSEFLRIDIGQDSLLGMRKFQFGININMLYVDVYVPEKEFASIQIDNDVGSTNISSIKASNVTVDSDVAGMTIGNIAARSINATSAVGSINIKNSTGKLNAINDVGAIDILMNEITDDISLQTNVGSIKVTVPTIPENVTFNGASDIGSINIFEEKGSYISKDADYVVMMQTDIGNIKVKALD